MKPSRDFVQGSLFEDDYLVRTVGNIARDLLQVGCGSSGIPARFCCRDFRYDLPAGAQGKGEMDDPQVLPQREVAAEWCGNATEYGAKQGGKPWKYLLIPHDATNDNMTLDGLADRFSGS
jgi:hypothetical protein